MLAGARPPVPKDSFVTLSFSFKRDGTLIGPPRPSGISVAGDADAKKKFVDAAIAAVEQCAPLEFAPALAAGMGGQVFTMQFTAENEAFIVPQWADGAVIGRRDRREKA